MQHMIQNAINFRNHLIMGTLKKSYFSISKARESIFNSTDTIFLGRLGNVEYTALLKYNMLNNIRGGIFKLYNKILGFSEKSFVRSLNLLNKNAGAYSVKPENFHEFNRIYLEALAELDVYAQWFYGDRKIAIWKSNIDVIPLEALNIVQRPNFFRGVFNNKKVLVVSSFENTIQKQYEDNRDRLFKHLEVDNLELHHVRSPFNIVPTIKNYDWYKDLSDLQQQVEKCIISQGIDYLIVGAGAFGLPVAHSAYKLGTNSLHLGGATQLLFGIRGNRWADSLPNKSDFWVNPLPSDIPSFSRDIEDGCYWS